MPYLKIKELARTVQIIMLKHLIIIKRTVILTDQLNNDCRYQCVI